MKQDETSLLKLSSNFQTYFQYFSIYRSCLQGSFRLCPGFRGTPKGADPTRMGKTTLCQFTGSGWGLWFSTRKWMLYKLGTQENLATDIKPIWGTLEKWQPPRSAFSKLWIVFFLRKKSPCYGKTLKKSTNRLCSKIWRSIVSTFTLSWKHMIMVIVYES